MTYRQYKVLAISEGALGTIFLGASGFSFRQLETNRAEWAGGSWLVGGFNLIIFMVGFVSFSECWRLGLGLMLFITLIELPVLLPRCCSALQ